MSQHIKYVGFVAHGEFREYTLIMRDAEATWQSFTLVIANQAFLDHRVRYQDGPDICYRKLHQEAAACENGIPPSRLLVSDEDLSVYKTTITAKPPKRRPRPPAELESDSEHR